MSILSIHPTRLPVPGDTLTIGDTRPYTFVTEPSGEDDHEIPITTVAEMQARIYALITEFGPATLHHDGTLLH